MHRRRRAHPIATLWQLVFGEDRISCAVYRAGGGFEMRLETGAGTILAEPFELRPKALSRMRALRRSLERRGWQSAGG